MAENEDLEPLEDEIPEEEETEGAPEAEEGSEDASEPEIDPEIEAEARKYGWKPKGEFTLEPKGWVDAARFLTMPKTQVKMARDREQEYKRELKERDERLSRIERMSKVAVERALEQQRSAYEAQLSDLETRKRQAAEVGDLEQYDALARRQQGLKPPEPVDEPQAAQQPTPDPAVSQYIETAAWTKDPDAFRYGHELIEANPHIKSLPPMKQVQWAEQQVKQHFPEHFPEDAPAPAKQRQRVDGGGLGGGSRRGKGADHLPPDALAIAKGFVADGLFKSVEEYAEHYFEQE